MSSSKSKKNKQKNILKALTSVVWEEIGKNPDAVNGYLCMRMMMNGKMPPDFIPFHMIADGTYGNIVFSDIKDVKKCKGMRRFLDQAARDVIRLLKDDVVRQYWENGKLALFRSCASAKDRMDGIVRDEAARLLKSVKAYTGHWTMGDIRKRYQSSTDFLKAEKKRYNRDRREDLRRQKEEDALSQPDRTRINPADYMMQVRLEMVCTPDLSLDLDDYGAALFKQEREDAENARRAEEMAIRAEAERQAQLHESVLDHIPDNYIDFFPLARTLKRHFTLHIGPTNSGKTYGAMEALKEAGSGIYLAPLRLLAYEKYEQLNLEGYPCTLLTGEERSEIEGAVFQASTIEMMDIRKAYDCVIIDEAQMVAEEERGGSWTSAILGACSENIHVCAAPIAEEILIRMITDCGDTYEIVRHQRMTPLVCETRPYSLLQNTRKGDALIVFSKKNVHAVASELQQKGIRCSVVYGALPYSVRHEQARLFAEGENEVVVATDAIGMGMNLPIRRVVFLETEKFDGKNQRPLETEEIKQIAGRAGRYGMYPEGRVTSQGERKMIRYNLSKESTPITHAVIAFPESLLGIEATLSEIIRKWDEIKINEGYRRADTKRMLELCEIVEQYSDDKLFQYQCITITFDEKIPELLDCWRDICITEAGGEIFPVESYLPAEEVIEFTYETLDALEQAFKLCDLLYSYCDKFRRYDYVPEIMERKTLISGKILKLLEEQKLSQRRCKRCGRILSWDYPYGLCQLCHDRMGHGHSTHHRHHRRYTGYT